MKTPLVAAALIGCTLFAAAVFAQERSQPLPLSVFVDVYTDQTATSAQKEVGLKKGTWYQGTVTVSETRFALFKECEILEILKPGK